jgi:hypothetical protein
MKYFEMYTGLLTSWVCWDVTPKKVLVLSIIPEMHKSLPMQKQVSGSPAYPNKLKSQLFLFHKKQERSILTVPTHNSHPTTHNTQQPTMNGAATSMLGD